MKRNILRKDILDFYQQPEVIFYFDICFPANRIREISSYTLFLNYHSNKVKDSWKVWGKVLSLVSGKKKLRKQERKHMKQKTPLENVGPTLKSCIAMTDLQSKVF